MIHGTYPRICTTDLRICILLQIMLYLSVDDKIPTKDNFFLHCSASYFLKVNLLKISKRKSQKQVQFSINQGFSYFFVCRWKDPHLFKYWQIRIWKAQKRTDPEAPHSLAVTVLIILISWKIKFRLLLRQLGGTTFLYLQVAKVGYHT
jgi:hypothetical protein